MNLNGEIPVEEIKQSVNIEDIVAEYVVLTKIGYSYKGLCPFHEDKNTESLSVVPRGMFKGKHTEGFFKCFSGACQVKGDVIKFVMFAENVEFKEACRILAEKGGVSYQEKKWSSLQVDHLKILRDRTIRYIDTLSENSNIMQYLYDRGLNDQDIEQWRIGLVPKDEHKYRPNETWLRDRLSFPILCGSNLQKLYTVSMGYRDLHGNDKKYKYMFDEVATTPTYEGKEHILYGLPYAKQDIKNKRYGIMVEGYFDVIALHKAGYKNTVSPCGCSLSNHQIQMMKQLSDSWLLWFDGDEAGILGMKKSIPLLLQEGLNVNVIIGKTNKDPDEMLKEWNYNPSKVKQLISNNSIPAAKMLLDGILESYENKVVKLKLNSFKKAKKVLENISDPEEKLIYENLIKKRLDI